MDEPWHHAKTPRYPTSELQDLYRAVKEAAAPGTDPGVLVQFSREIWRQKDDPSTQWEAGIADVPQISALEFQDGRYHADLLEGNHTWSRRLIHAATPHAPLWSSVQVFGANLGPHDGYWFPRPDDLRRLLRDLTEDPFQREHPLTGVTLQQWDSATREGRPHQFTLGDRYFPDQPTDQAQASAAALEVIRGWLSGSAP